MREAGLFFYFYFLKNRRGMYLHELLYSPTMFHGRCTTAPDDIWANTRAMLDIKSGDFLENCPSQLHNGTRHYKERCDACIPALNHIKINTKRVLDFQKIG